MAQKRILYLDVVKAIAITLVLIGHAPVLVTLDEPSILVKWIYSFHMPLFMLICGYFSVHSFNKPFKEFIANKTLRLLIPAISFSLLEFLLIVILGMGDVKENAFGVAVGGMWFIRTLFACYFYVYLVKLIPLKETWLCIGSILFALFFPHGYFLQFNFMLFFFWGGCLIREHKAFFEYNMLVITIISAAYFIFLGRHEEPVIFSYGTIFHNTWVIPQQIMTGLTGSLAVIGIVYYICRYFHGNIIKKFGKVGQYTLGIYGVQTLVLLRLFRKFFHFNLQGYSSFIGDFIIIPTLGITATIVCYYIVIWLSKSKWTNLLLFGNQY